MADAISCMTPHSQIDYIVLEKLKQAILGFCQCSNIWQPMFPTAQLQQSVKLSHGWLATDSQPLWEPETLIDAADGQVVQTTGFCT